MHCVVLKSFPGPGGVPFLPGELVDASGFKLRDKLIDQKKLRPATPREIDGAVDIDDSGEGTKPSSSSSLKAKKRKK
jgi:hypothetical protein